MNNKFRFFSDNITFEKSSKDGKDVYLVGGLITDSSKDADGENLATEGLDFSDFNFINWNHSKEPGDIIGTPLTWKYIEGKGVMMKGELYADIPKANDAIRLMKALERSGRGNKLGWSIEGQVIERDLIDSSKVRASDECAVCDLLHGFGKHEGLKLAVYKCAVLDGDNRLAADIFGDNEGFGVTRVGFYSHALLIPLGSILGLLCRILH